MIFQNRYIPVLFFVYHLVFSVVAYYFIMQNHGDAVRYWFFNEDLSNASWSQYLHLGTSIIYAICYPFVQFFNAPFWFGFLMFSLWSFIGWWQLYKLTKQLVHNQSITIQIILMLLLWLPNQHFWTSVIGKEAFIFTPLVFFVRGIALNRTKTYWFWISILVILAVRPHIGGILIGVLGIYFLFNRKLSFKQRIFILVPVTIGVLGSLFFLQSIMLGNWDLIDKIKWYYTAYNEQLKNTNAYVPLEDYSLPYKVFTFYFRPFPWDGNSIWYYFAGAENILLLLGCIILFYKIVRGFSLKMIDYVAISLLSFIVFFILMYIYGYANFGLILRTKVSIFPFVMVLFAYMNSRIYLNFKEDKF